MPDAVIVTSLQLPLEGEQLALADIVMVELPRSAQVLFEGVINDWHSATASAAAFMTQSIAVLSAVWVENLARVVIRPIMAIATIATAIKDSMSVNPFGFNLNMRRTLLNRNPFLPL